MKLTRKNISPDVGSTATVCPTAINSSLRGKLWIGRRQPSKKGKESAGFSGCPEIQSRLVWYMGPDAK